MSAAVVRWIISGRVQGVGFRWYVRNEASRLGVSGWVRNQRDGTVEVVASGPVDAIARLHASLASGPSPARVDKLDRTDVKHEVIELKSFEIR